ncbi:MAG: FAD-dependent oxidoreductase [Acidimicrobiales bacterium]|nr:FAD-dependent oxidoreductase [Acidimicrobiales bacterium]
MTTADPLPWENASLWSRSLPGGSSTPAVIGARRYDAVVIGGGLTGLLTAVVLQRAGVDVIVLERHDSIGGVTTRGSTGKLTALQGSMLSTITQLCDAGAAAQYAQACLFGVGAMRNLIDDLGIDCSLTRADDHTFATEPEADTKCAELLQHATAAGLPVRWVDATELPFPILGAVQLADQAHLDPGALCAGLAGVLGERVVTGCVVTGVDESTGGVEVSLADGRRLTADHVITATLGPVYDPALLTTRCEATRSYAIASPHTAPPQGMYISLDESSRSIRPATIEGAPAVVVAGKGHVVGKPGDESPDERLDELDRYAQGSLGAQPAMHRWAAHDLVPSDSVPFIGRSAPGKQRSWVATGFGKWGISTAMVTADLILGEMEGRRRQHADVFEPGRLADNLTKKLVRDAARSLQHTVIDRVEELLPGRERHPTCTHMGCRLRFDDREQTWDCPCHGSRFDAAGQVVCGPAVADLDL